MLSSEVRLQVMELLPNIKTEEVETLTEFLTDLIETHEYELDQEYYKGQENCNCDHDLCSCSEDCDCDCGKCGCC